MSQIVCESSPVFTVFSSTLKEKTLASKEEIARVFLEGDSSGEAKELISKFSPALYKQKEEVSPLAIVQGASLKRNPNKDPYTEEVKRVATNGGLVRPTPFDALYFAYAVISNRCHFSYSWIVVMHDPVKEMLLGVSFENGRPILTAHKADPRKGWYCSKGAFAFRKVL